MNFLNNNLQDKKNNRKGSLSVQSETTNTTNIIGKKREGLLISKQFLIIERLYKGLFYNTYKGNNKFQLNYSYNF